MNAKAIVQGRDREMRGITHYDPDCDETGRESVAFPVPRKEMLTRVLEHIEKPKGPTNRYRFPKSRILNAGL